MKHMELADIPSGLEGPTILENASVNDETVLMDGFIKDIKYLIENSQDSKSQLNQYITEVEEKIEYHRANRLSKVDKEEIKGLIEKHPYFKNPCNYHIRIITIMKYLKKKGIDISIPDIDLLVEEVILTIDGVKSTGDGRYTKKKV